MIMRRNILAASAVALIVAGGTFAAVSAQADPAPPSGNKLPAGNAQISQKAVHGLPASAADAAKAKPHIARFMAGAGTAQVVRGHGADVLDALFGTESRNVAGDSYARLAGHDLLVSVSKGAVSTDMVPLAPGAKVGPFRSALTVTDASDGKLVTALLVGVDDPPAKDNLARFNVAPTTVTVSAAEHTQVHKGS
jgi:hypothetical protein